MGTYQQPDIIKNDPFGAMRAGVQKGFEGMAKAQQASNAAAAKQAAASMKAANKAAADEKKKLKEGYKWKAKLNSLDQVDEPSFQNKFKGFVNQKIDDELMTTEFESQEWYDKVEQIQTYVNLSDNAIKLLEREVEEYKKQFTITQSPNGGPPVYTPNKPGVGNSRLLTNNKEENDNYLIIEQLVRNNGKGIKFSSGENNSNVGLSMEHPDNERIDPTTQATYYLKPGDNGYKPPIEFNFKVYQDAKADGYDLINSTSQDKFNTSTENTFALTGGKSAFNDLKEEFEKIKSSGGKMTTSTVITYERSRDMIREKIVNDLDRYLPDDPNEIQNNWQLLQGAAQAGMPAVFDRNDPAQRAMYSKLLAEKVIADNEKDDQVFNEVKKAKLSDSDVRMNNYRNDGIPTTSTRPSAGVEAFLSRQVSSDGQTNLAEVLMSGKIKPADIHKISESIKDYQRGQGDPVSRGDVLIDILNQSSGNAQMGKKYHVGEDIQQDVLNNYRALYLKLHPTQVQSPTVNAEILKFAAGKMPQKPHDKATWNDPNQPFAVQGLFGGADKIGADDVWQTGVGKPRRIIDENNFTTELMDDLIYRSLDISARERQDLKSGVNLGGTSSTKKTTVNLGNKNNKPTVTPPQGKKWEWNDNTKKWQLVKA